MSRYIDADALIEDFHTVNPQYKTKIEWACRVVDSAPSIDIVRCKECNAYMTDGYADGCGFCAYHHSVVQADDYCSYGERKE